MKTIQFTTMKNKSSELSRYRDMIKNNASFEEQRLITDLVAELAIALHSRANLENENASLKLECKDLQIKMAECERTSKEEKDRLIEDVKESQVKIKEKEMVLAKKDVQQFEEQKKHMMEVSELRATYYKEKGVFEKKEMELQNEINKLKIETVEINNNYNLCKDSAEALQKKYIKYKSKVKYAVGIINTLTAALKKCSKKPVNTCDKGCQTNYGNDKNPQFVEHYASSCSLHSQCVVETDKIVLAELFFKQHPSDKNIENLFFIPGNKSNDSEDDL